MEMIRSFGCVVKVIMPNIKHGLLKFLRLFACYAFHKNTKLKHFFTMQVKRILKVWAVMFPALQKRCMA